MIIGILGAIVALVVIAWVIIAGPVTVGRVIRYGDTKIDDFRKYPARHMAASTQPHQLTEAILPSDISVPAFSGTGGTIELDALLQTTDTIAFLVVKNDRLVIERYYQGHTRQDLSQVFSMSKSITSILVGMAIADGYIESVDQVVTDFIPELADEGFTNVTIRHLLTMTSGSSYIEGDNPFGVHVILNYTPELEKEILGFRMKDEPGTVWRYKSGDTALLGLILRRVLAPKTITEYTSERLWSPLGMEYGGLWSLDREGDGLERTWCCMSAAARDILKLGLLYLHDGQWQGEQIVPAEWVRESTQTGAIADHLWGDDYRGIGVWSYGYQWWLLDRDDRSYLANGKDGQYLYVNPATQTVVLRLGWSTGKAPLSRWLRLFEYLSDTLE